MSFASNEYRAGCPEAISISGLQDFHSLGLALWCRDATEIVIAISTPSMPSSQLVYTMRSRHLETDTPTSLMVCLDEIRLS